MSKKMTKKDLKDYIISEATKLYKIEVLKEQKNNIDKQLKMLNENGGENLNELGGVGSIDLPQNFNLFIKNPDFKTVIDNANIIIGFVSNDTRKEIKKALRLCVKRVEKNDRLNDRAMDVVYFNGELVRNLQNDSIFMNSNNKISEQIRFSVNIISNIAKKFNSEARDINYKQTFNTPRASKISDINTNDMGDDNN